MSLRSLVRSRWLWAVVIVWWVLAILGVFVSINTGINWGLPIAVMATLIVAGLKAAEYLTRPAQTAQQAAKRRKTRKA